MKSLRTVIVAIMASVLAHPVPASAQEISIVCTLDPSTYDSTHDISVGAGYLNYRRSSLSKYPFIFYIANGSRVAHQTLSNGSIRDAIAVVTPITIEIRYRTSRLGQSWVIDRTSGQIKYVITSSPEIEEIMSGSCRSNQNPTKRMF